ncbi:hypothetical protein QMA61_36825 [Streptomyces coelicoflavus]|uniref:hypothetical protein n=1 Tax=Streptomyces coelicoflavus TaxID=285562 RepID=UPI0024AE4CBE|nr:hypothetical protein [Streptomyces coelicoflavus]MDI6521741.1 hypothetical protein [Streptomyces coelicoflavus]
MKGPTTGSVPDRRMTPARTLIFAIAAGMAVGNLYWAQPLIEVIASSLGVSSSSATTLVTVTQVGYALGIFLIVPLGDVLNRRRLIPLILSLSAVTLLRGAPHRARRRRADHRRRAVADPARQ